jgi:predicted O-linked N-acetylglucosamine transferase (SPINDLY family)
MDPLLGGILRQDPQGKVAFIKGNQPALAEALTRRWERTIPDVAHRIQWVPPLSQEQFIAAQVLADVLLDTPVFSGGNTSLEALAFGQPVVTLPSPYAKGRITTAWYHQMGLAECVAHSPEAYIQLAVQLGSDRNFRQQMKDKILAAQPVLFDNPAGIRELEALFLSWTRPEGTP